MTRTRSRPDGDYPGVREALVAGVIAAKDRARRRGLDHLRVGFNTAPLFGPGEAFVGELARAGGERFQAELDYVGLDFFPDVFSPIPPDTLAGAVTGLLTHQRGVLAPADLAEVPIRVTENGWPTGPARPEHRQAEVVETVVRAVHAVRGDLDIAGYTHFSLRDADSDHDGLFHRFGLMTDRYRPKPAFDDLIHAPVRFSIIAMLAGVDRGRARRGTCRRRSEGVLSSQWSGWSWSEPCGARRRSS